MISIKTNIGLHSHISITLIFNALTKFYKQQKTKFKLKALFSQSNQRLLVYSRRKKVLEKGEFTCKKQGLQQKYYEVLCSLHSIFELYYDVNYQCRKFEPRTKVRHC